MIPLKMHIKNFLSYGPETQIIDFASYPLICLSGKNGHGKSALLDAITWALWGQARKIGATAKADQGLLHLGQTLMMVSLEFECNSQRYRIKREYAQTYGKPYALLEFAVHNPDTDAYVALTDKTIRATQEKIEQTLHLNFDAFVNSAFLRQGQSNEFSKKSPKDRKDILASILGLNQFEQIKKKAVEKTKQAMTQKTVLDTLQENITNELQIKDSIAQEMSQLEHSFQQLSEQESKLTAHLQQIDQKLAQLTAQQQELERLSVLKSQKEKTAEQVTQHILQLLNIWKEVNRKRRACKDLSSLEEDKQKIVSQLPHIQMQIQQLLTTKEQLISQQALLHKLTSELTIAFQQQQQNQQFELLTIETERKTIEKVVFEKSSLLTRLNQEKAVAQKDRQLLATELLKLTADSAIYEAVEKQFEKRKEHYQKYIMLGNALKKELEDIEHKQLLAHDDNDPSCPLCEQNLSASRKRFLKTKFEERKLFIQRRIKRLAGLIKQLKELLIAQHEQLNQQKKNAQQLSILTIKVDELEKTIETHTNQLELIAVEITGAQALMQQLSNKKNQVSDQIQKMDSLEKVMLNNDEYMALQTNSALLQSQITTLPKVIEQQKALLNSLEAIEQRLHTVDTLKKDIARQEQRSLDIIHMCAQAKEHKKEITALHKRMSDFAQSHELLKKTQQEQESIKKQMQEHRIRKEQLLQEKGNLQARQKNMTALQEQFQNNLKKINELAAHIEDYQMIAQATSKDGIQALLIEDAIPEIEQEANALLAKLTDNQAQIFIESLRDLKKGGTKETLDIKISDSIGIRPYELFSGGEAFRIDFALRIAISKLLARRAGTALQTLIIDEGFGSQDEDGLSNIMDAIHKIQEDFAKVIIVSHLSTMKDQFPVHFFIEKGAQGSTLKVIEHG